MKSSRSTLDGTGQAYAIRDGLFYEVTWNRPAKDSVLYLTFPDGSLYPFKPGNTWFQVVGETTQTTNPFENVWRIVFGFLVDKQLSNQDEKFRRYWEAASSKAYLYS